MPLLCCCRADAVHGWVAACQSRNVPCNERFELGAVLGDPVKVRQRAGGICRE